MPTIPIVNTKTLKRRLKNKIIIAAVVVGTYFGVTEGLAWKANKEYVAQEASFTARIDSLVAKGKGYVVAKAAFDSAKQQLYRTNLTTLETKVSAIHPDSLVKTLDLYKKAFGINKCLEYIQTLSDEYQKMGRSSQYLEEKHVETLFEKLHEDIIKNNNEFFSTATAIADLCVPKYYSDSAVRQAVNPDFVMSSPINTPGSDHLIQYVKAKKLMDTTTARLDGWLEDNAASYHNFISYFRGYLNLKNTLKLGNLTEHSLIETWADSFRQDIENDNLKPQEMLETAAFFKKYEEKNHYKIRSLSVDKEIINAVIASDLGK